MISLRNDIYAHMVLAAQKYKTPRTVPSAVPSSKLLSLQVDPKKDSSLIKPAIKNRISSGRPEKIDEKVIRLLENPQLHALQEQLEQLAVQFNSLRATAAAEDVMRIEKKILFLENLLNAKSYI